MPPALEYCSATAMDRFNRLSITWLPIVQNRWQPATLVDRDGSILQSLHRDRSVLSPAPPAEPFWTMMEPLPSASPVEIINQHRSLLHTHRSRSLFAMPVVYWCKVLPSPSLHQPVARVCFSPAG